MTRWVEGYCEGKVVKVTQALYNDDFIPDFYIDEQYNIYEEKYGYESNVMNLKKHSFNKNDKYPCIRVREWGVLKNYKIHRIVASTFMPIWCLDNPPVGIDEESWSVLRTLSGFMSTLYDILQINHIDHDPWNYKLSNLEWCTAKANIKKAHEHYGHGVYA